MLALLTLMLLCLQTGDVEQPTVAADAALRCDLDVKLEPARRHLQASASVELPPSAGAAPLRFRLRADLSVLSVEGIADDGTARALGFRRAAGPAAGPDADWELDAPPAESRALRVSYAGGDTTSLNFHVGPEGCFVDGGSTAWYPQFDERRVHGHLRIRVPVGQVVQTGGTLVSQQDEQAESVFEYRFDQPTRMAFVAGAYQVLRREGRIPFSVCLLEARPDASELLDVGVRALEVLEREFGPYPFGEIAIVEVPQGPAQESGFVGASYEGLLLVRSDFLHRTGADAAHFGHELGHQWWPNLVRNSGPDGEYLLDEALAQFGALRVVEALLGSTAAERFRRGVEGLGGARDALRLMAAGYDWPLAHLPVHDAAYALADSKGMLVYAELARAVGPEALRRAFRDVLEEHAYGAVSWSEFRAAIEAASGQALDWFWAQWTERGGAPCWTSSWTQSDGRLRLSVCQELPAYRLRLPVHVQFTDGSVRVHEVEVDGPSTQVELVERWPIEAVVVDPRHEVFHADVAALAEARDMAPMTRALLDWNAGRDAEARAAFEDAIAHPPTPDPHGVEFVARVHLGWLLQEAGEDGAALEQYERSLQLALRPVQALEQLYRNLTRLLPEPDQAERKAWAQRELDSLHAAQPPLSSR